MEHSLQGRRRVDLAEVDNAPFRLIHAKICMVAGIGFFADAYNIFSISIAATMLGYVYGECSASETVDPSLRSLKTGQDLVLKVATPIGTAVGQLIFGWLADVLGRRRMYGIEMFLIIFATFGQTLVPKIATASTMMIMLGILRFVMGLGADGNYPISAVVTSEFAPARYRGRMVASVFACQGWGSLASALVPFTLVATYKQPILSSIQAQNGNEKAYIDTMWRIVIGLGAIPACIALYARLTITESPRFTMDIRGNIDDAVRDINSTLERAECLPSSSTSVTARHAIQKRSWDDLRQYFRQLRNFKALFGTAFSWFALDVAFYTLNLNTPIILEVVAFGQGANFHDSSTTCGGSYSAGIFHVLLTSSRGNLILSAATLIPGYWFSFALIDVWGRKPIQLMGFIILTILFMIMGFAYNHLRLHAMPWFVFLYSMANFFQNFGPNVTTFVVPAKIFPTRYRATAYGVCAASGKLGAVVAQIGFSSIQVSNKNYDDNNVESVQKILQLIAFFMLSGIFSTLLSPETKGKTLEELSGEAQESIDHEASIPLLLR